MKKITNENDPNRGTGRRHKNPCFESLGDLCAGAWNSGTNISIQTEDQIQMSRLSHQMNLPEHSF